MPYKLLDKNGLDISHIDLQDKSSWCKDGECIEYDFIDIFGERLNLKINPEKDTNKYAPRS